MAFSQYNGGTRFVKHFTRALHTYIYPTVLQVPTALLFGRSLDCIWSPVSFDVPPPFILPEKQEVNIMGCDEGKYSFLKRDGFYHITYPWLAKVTYELYQVIKYRCVY